ncbi:MAG TPA: C13 family peptidase [Candidatus Lokiarchaeia archaeon]|nr:C13 family peptidase [Candidatus Lokiarchaeia archaeon]
MNKKYLLGGIVAVVIIGAVVLVELWPFMPWNQTNGPKGFPTFDNPPVVDTPIAAPAFAGQNIRVDVNVTDDNMVSQVFLNWSNDSMATWHSTAMTGSGTTNWTGYGYIPPQDIETTVYYQISAEDNASQWMVNNNSGNAFSVYTGSRKAIIVNGDNQFYHSSPNDNFNNGGDSNLEAAPANWSAEFDGSQTTGGFAPGQGVGSSNCIQLFSVHAGPVNGNWTLDLGRFYPPIINYTYYNLTAQVRTASPGFTGDGLKVGLRWKNGPNEVHMDWSNNESNTGTWMQVSCCGVCTNNSLTPITNVSLVLSLNGSAASGGIAGYFDDVKLYPWASVTKNATSTGPFPPPNPPAPAFPAQALQVYWTLKNHGFTDSNIFLMLYNVGEDDIRIRAGEPNALTGAVVDLANASVTSKAFKDELNVSWAGSFAASIQPNDELIIFMTDHGSNNQLLPDTNATFCFAADNSYITEYEFYNLVKNITCWRMLINVDCCYSGNFLQSDNVGPTWYNLPNAILVSASANVQSWYWMDTNNLDNFAGSWMFHPFWDALNQSKTIDQAFSAGVNFQPQTPPPPFQTVLVIQTPLMQDYLGCKTTWSFASFPKL